MNITWTLNCSNILPVSCYSQTHVQEII